MATKLLESYKQKISQLTLVPGSGGCFELLLNGELVYSKLQTGSFPEENDIVDLVGRQLGS